MKHKNLEELALAMRCSAPETLDRVGQWRSDLPTFGGEDPECTNRIWSWDADRLLVGGFGNDLQIINRADKAKGAPLPLRIFVEEGTLQTRPTLTGAVITIDEAEGTKSTVLLRGSIEVGMLATRLKAYADHLEETGR